MFVDGWAPFEERGTGSRMPIPTISFEIRSLF